MTRTRPLSGAAGEGPLPSQSTSRCYLSWPTLPGMLWFFFSAPLTVNTICTDGISLVISPKEESQSHLPPISCNCMVPEAVDTAGTGDHPSLLPPPSFPSVPIQAPDVRPHPLPADGVARACPSSFLPFCFWPRPSTAQARQLGQSTQSRAGSSLRRACQSCQSCQFPRCDSRNSRACKQGAHFKHATPHPHTRQGHARLHARTRLPVGPRIAIPACARACKPGTART